MPAPNMSFATFRYLERYNLLPENFNPEQYLGNAHPIRNLITQCSLTCIMQILFISQKKQQTSRAIMATLKNLITVQFSTEEVGNSPDCHQERSSQDPTFHNWSHQGISIISCKLLTRVIPKVVLTQLHCIMHLQGNILRQLLQPVKFLTSLPCGSNPNYCDKQIYI